MGLGPTLRREMLGEAIEIQALVADFAAAHRLAVAKAASITADPLLVAWYDRRRGRSSPQIEGCQEEIPAWLAYARSRRADLIIDLNQEEYVFCFRRN